LKNREIIPVEAKVKGEIRELAKTLRALNLNKAILLHEEKYREVKRFDNIQIEIIPFFELAFYGSFFKH
jgi:hypothetical protein